MMETEFNTPKDLYAHYQAVATRLRNRHYVYPVTPIAKAVVRERVLEPVAVVSQTSAVAQMIHAAEAVDETVSEGNVSDVTPETFWARVESGELVKSRKVAQRMIELIADKHGFTFGEVIGTGRYTTIVNCRREVYWTLVKKFGFSLMETARLVEKDHTSVLHGVRMYEKELAK